MIVNDLITNALKRAGVKAAGETPNAAESADALLRLNAMVDLMGTDKPTMYTRTRTTATITASQASYTVGASANINIARPVFLDDVKFIDTADDPDYEFPLERLTEAGYANIPAKALTAPIPRAWYYNPTFDSSGYATLIPWPIPTNTTLLWAIYHWAAVAQFAATSDTFSLPPGYWEYFESNLAVAMCPEYKKTPSPILMRQANKSAVLIRRANKRLKDVEFDPAVLGPMTRSWDIRTGY